jgi:hypothetical protein
MQIAGDKFRRDIERRQLTKRFTPSANLSKR